MVCRVFLMLMAQPTSKPHVVIVAPIPGRHSSSSSRVTFGRSEACPKALILGVLLQKAKTHVNVYSYIKKLSKTSYFVLIILYSLNISKCVIFSRYGEAMALMYAPLLRPVRPPNRFGKLTPLHSLLLYWDVILLAIDSAIKLKSHFFFGLFYEKKKSEVFRCFKNGIYIIQTCSMYRYVYHILSWCQINWMTYYLSKTKIDHFPRYCYA